MSDARLLSDGDVPPTLVITDMTQAHQPPSVRESTDTAGSTQLHESSGALPPLGLSALRRVTSASTLDPSYASTAVPLAGRRERERRNRASRSATPRGTGEGSSGGCLGPSANPVMPGFLTPRSRLLQRFVSSAKLAEEEDEEDAAFVLGGAGDDDDDDFGSDSRDASFDGAQHSRSDNGGMGTGTSRQFKEDSVASSMHFHSINARGASQQNLLAADTAHGNPKTLQQAGGSGSDGHELLTHRDDSGEERDLPANGARRRMHHAGQSQRWWRPRIPRSQRHSLSAWEKMRRYRRVPCKLLLNLLVLVLLLVQLFRYEIDRSHGDERERRMLTDAVMPEGYLSTANEDYVLCPTFYFFKPADILEHFQKTVDLYYSISTHDPGDVNYVLNPKYTIADATRIMEAERRALHLPRGIFVNSSLIKPPLMTSQLRVKSERLTQRASSDETFVSELTVDQPFGPFQVAAAGDEDEDDDNSNDEEDGSGSGSENGGSLFDLACSPREDHVHGGYFSVCRREAMQRAIFDNVDNVEIQFRIQQMVQSSLEKEVSIYVWEIRLRYNFEDDAVCRLTSHIGPSILAHVSGLQPTLVMAVMLMACAVLDIILRLRSILRLHRYRQMMRHRYRQRVQELRRAIEEEKQFTSDSSSSSSSSCNSLSSHEGGSSSNGSSNSDPAHKQHHISQRRLEQRLSRFQKRWRQGLRNDMGRGWALFAIFSDLIVLAFATMDFIQSLSVENASSAIYTRMMLLGLSCLFTTTLLISNFRYYPKVYFMIRATSGALPHLGYFFVGVGPIFVSFALFGTIVFGGQSNNFADFGRSCVTLYCAIYGDSLMPLFQTVGTSDSLLLLWTSRLFAGGFIGFFMWTVLNLSLAIVVDSYTYVSETFGLWETRRVEMERLGFGKSKGVLMSRTKEQVATEALRAAQEQLRIALNAMTAGNLGSDVDADEHAAMGRSRGETLPRRSNSRSATPSQAHNAVGPTPAFHGVSIAPDTADGVLTDMALLSSAASNPYTRSNDSNPKFRKRHYHHHHHHHLPQRRDVGNGSLSEQPEPGRVAESSAAAHGSGKSPTLAPAAAPSEADGRSRTSSVLSRRSSRAPHRGHGGSEHTPTTMLDTVVELTKAIVGVESDEESQ